MFLIKGMCWGWKIKNEIWISAEAMDHQNWPVQRSYVSFAG